MKPDDSAAVAAETRDPQCDCGTCCDQCGHYPGCSSGKG